MHSISSKLPLTTSWNLKRSGSSVQRRPQCYPGKVASCQVEVAIHPSHCRVVKNGRSKLAVLTLMHLSAAQMQSGRSCFLSKLLISRSSISFQKLTDCSMEAGRKMLGGWEVQIDQPTCRWKKKGDVFSSLFWCVLFHF